MNSFVARLSFFIVLAVSAHTFAQTTRRAPPGQSSGNMTTGSNSSTAPGPVTMQDSGQSGQATTQSSSPQEEAILKAAQRLGFTPDQLTQLNSFLKSKENDGAEAEKELQNARTALANALTNGQTYLDYEIETYASASAKLQAFKLKLWAGLNSIATPDQRTQLLTMSTPLSLAISPSEHAQSQ